MPRKIEAVPTTEQEYWKKVAPRQIQKKKCGDKFTNTSFDTKNLLKYHKECQDKHQNDMAFFQPETCEKGVLKDSYCKIVKRVKPNVFHATRVGSTPVVNKKIKEKQQTVQPKQKTKEKQPLTELEKDTLQRMLRHDRKAVEILSERRREDPKGGYAEYECDGQKVTAYPKSILNLYDAACEKQLKKASIYIPPFCKNGKLKKPFCLSYKAYKEELK